MLLTHPAQQKTTPITALNEAVPVGEIDHPTVITIHTHKIIVEREGWYGKVLSTVESITLIAASVSLIALSASTVIFASNLLAN